MRGVKYVGPVSDFSGYGEAARNYVLSLHKKGVPITVFPRNFDPNPPSIADKEEKEILDSLIGKKIDYDVVIVHLTPDLYPQYAERGKYNIGFSAWETSLLHPKWANACSVMSELWVPCDWNVQAFKDSDVQVPIYKIPHGIDVDMFNGLDGEKFNIKGVGDSTYKFYSIFQWMHRKNPDGLLRAYFNAFTDQDNVVLVLKTYRMGMPKDKEIIRDAIINIKKDMGIGRYPKVVLIGDLLSKLQMLGLHKYGDCYAGLPRGEGFGLPFFEAGLAGNPVIAPGHGGQLEFLREDNSFLVDYSDTYVSSMSSFNSWYLGNQKWAEPSQVNTAEAMYYVYTHQEEASKKGKLLSNYIKNNFSWDIVASIIVDRLGNVQ
jgi:glycosyltransferase involved in cell wall biosynthesis